MARGVLRVKIVGDDNDFRRALSGASSAAATFGKAAAAAGVAAVAGFGVVAVRAFANFDAALQESVAIMGDVSDAMRTDMSDAAREVAKTTKFSAEEAAQSYFFLASAGLDAAASIEALPKVAAFAQAGNFDMARATDLLTDAQSALGLATDDTADNLENMARVGDVLVKANTLSNASVEQFSEALTNKAGASMRSLNMDMEEGVAVLGVFADQGIKGSQAGTTFNAVIRGLTDGARKNADAFDALGVEVFNSQGELNNMADIVGQLESGLDGMSVEQQRAALASMGFTEETVAGTLALIGNSEAISEYEAALRDAGGTVDEVASKQLETFNAKLGLLRDRFMDVAIQVGSVIVPKLIEALDWLESWWAENGPQVVARIKAIGEAAVVWWQETAVPALGNFRDELVRFWEETAKPLLAQLQQAWVDNKDTLAEAFDAAGQIIVDLGSIVAQVFGKAETDVQDSTGTIGQAIGDTVTVMRDLLVFVQQLTEWFDRWVDPILDVARAIDQLTNPLRVVRNLMADIADLKDQVGGVLSGDTPIFKRPDFSSITDRLKGAIPGFANGALVTRPTLAMVGESSRTTPEIVSPESLMRQIVREESGGRGDINLTVYGEPSRATLDDARVFLRLAAI